MKTKDQVVRHLVPPLPAVLVWAMHGAVRLMRRGHYTQPKSHTEAIGRWRTESNSVSAWLDAEALRRSANGHDWMKAQAAYKRYHQWCESNNMRAVSSPKFGKRMIDLGFKKDKRSDATYYGISEVEEVEHVKHG